MSKKKFGIVTPLVLLGTGVFSLMFAAGANDGSFLFFATLFVMFLLALPELKSDPLNFSSWYSAFFFVTFWVKPFLIKINSDFMTWPTFWPKDESIVNYSYILIIVSFCLFMLGYHGAPFRPIANRLTRTLPCPPETLNIRRASFVAFGLLILGTLAKFWFMYTVAGGFNVFEFADTFYNDRVGASFGQGHLLLAGKLMAVGLFVYYAYINEHKAVYARIVFWPFAMVVIALSTFVGASRGDMLFVMAPLATYYHYKVRRFTVRWTVIAGTVLFFLSNVPKIMAAYITGQEFVGVVRQTADSYDGYDLFLAVLQTFPSQHQYFFGQTMFEELFYTLIPRAIWPGKPDLYGLPRIQDAFMPDSVGSSGSHYSSSLLGDFYSNFSIVGIIVFSLIFGILYRSIYDKLKQTDFHSFYVFFYGIIMLEIIGFLRGGTGIFSLTSLTVIMYGIFRFVYSDAKSQGAVNDAIGNRQPTRTGVSAVNSVGTAHTQ